MTDRLIRITTALAGGRALNRRETRAVSEAVAAALQDHVLIVPQNRQAIAFAISKAAGTRRCVLWLDDLENYLGPGGLTRAGIARVLAGKRSYRVIVATLRSAEEHASLPEAGQQEGGWQSRRDAREVLEQAWRIPLSRMFSRSEEEQARARAWDPRIADALARAGVYGLAEYLAAGPQS